MEKFKEYFLSQNLFMHTKSARTIDVLDNHLISGSYDGRAVIFTKEKNYGSPIEIKFDFDIYCVKVLKNSKGYLIGGKDGKIYLANLKGELVKNLEGHTGIICSLSEGNSNLLISGSWDATARIWDLNNYQCLFTLEGHSYAVAVLALSTGLYITSSQDPSINFWENGKKFKTIKQAHNDIIREFSELPNNNFVSCSNDMAIKIWNFNGECLRTWDFAHEGFIYTIKGRGPSSFVTGGDDCILKIWENDLCLQTIGHPNVIWQVAIDNENNIITACSDGLVRIFSQDPGKRASESEIDTFLLSCKERAMQSGYSQSEIDKLPDIKDIFTVFGKKDGEIRVFRNEGTPEAFVWKANEGIWEKIGEVVGARQAKKFYEGDKWFPAGEYDFVFDVEDETGIPKKIPFNHGDNPLLVAEKYIVRENLSKQYFLEQICSFLTKNTKPFQAKTGQSSHIPAKAQQNMPKNEPKPQMPKEPKPTITKYKYFPNVNLIFSENIKLESLKKKCYEFNEKLSTSENPTLAMKISELAVFDNILKRIEETNSLFQSSALTPFELNLIPNKLIHWPPQYLFPIFDLIRIFLLNFNAEPLFAGLDNGIAIIMEICKNINNENNEVLSNLGLQIFCNMFKLNSTKYAAIKHFDIIADCWEKIMTNFGNSSKIKFNLLNDFINYSVSIYRKDFPGLSEARQERFCNIVLKNFQNEKEDENNIMNYCFVFGNAFINQYQNFPGIRNNLVAILQNIQSLFQGKNSPDLLECIGELMMMLSK